MSFLALLKRYIGPVLIVAGGFLLAIVIIATGPRPDRQARPPDAPSVQTVEAVKRTAQLTVTAHGTVVPKTESNLVAEVSGRVVAVSPSMVSGGFFSKGDVLIEIERIDYEAALEQARAALASAESELANAELTFNPGGGTGGHPVGQPGRSRHGPEPAQCGPRGFTPGVGRPCAGRTRSGTDPRDRAV